MAGSPARGGGREGSLRPGPGRPAPPPQPCPRLTKSLRCRAQTRPSPPLFPGPQMTSTVGGLLDMDVGGYA